MDLAARRGELCSTSNAVGVGLRGDYFAAESCKGALLLSRTDAVVDFDATLDWPSGRGAPPRSVRWSGWIKPSITGIYRLHCDAPGARLQLSRQTMSGEGAASDARIELGAGRFYPVILEVGQLSKLNGRIRLEWTVPHGARLLIQRPLLHLPTDTVGPART